MEYIKGRNINFTKQIKHYMKKFKIEKVEKSRKFIFEIRLFVYKKIFLIKSM